MPFHGRNALFANRPGRWQFAAPQCIKRETQSWFAAAHRQTAGV